MPVGPAVFFVCLFFLCLKFDIDLGVGSTCTKIKWLYSSSPVPSVPPPGLQCTSPLNGRGVGSGLHFFVWAGPGLSATTAGTFGCAVRVRPVERVKFKS
jgi:hypothetical protein